MGLLQAIKEKSFPSGLNLKQKEQDKGWIGISGIQEVHVDEILKDVNHLLERFPGSPQFLGKNKKYPTRRRRLILPQLKRTPNLTDLRDEVNRFSESTKVTDPRKKIRRLLKKNPYLPDLRALNGIQIFNDASQSGLDEKKLRVIEGALVEVGGAINNWGISIFNVTWFIKIYLRYLELLKERYTHEYVAIKDNKYREVRKASEDLNRAVLQLTSMIAIKGKLGGLAMLNAKLKGSAYIAGTVAKSEIRAACNAAVAADLDRTVGPGKTANYVLLVVMTLELLFARIPLLRHLVVDILKSIPDVSRDLILQKNMISTMISVTDFQLALSSGDINRSREVAERLFERCRNVISQHLEYSILTKPHEVDPFLKAAWIAKESNGLIRESEYRARLEEANKYLHAITGNQGKVKGAFELARQLQNDISFIMAEYGWSMYG